jgi:hypothetical protein
MIISEIGDYEKFISRLSTPCNGFPVILQLGDYDPSGEDIVFQLHVMDSMVRGRRA